MAMAVNQWLDQRLQPYRQRYALLPVRDQRALVALGLFLLVFVLGGSMWWMHRTAQKAERHATEQRELLLWMQANAGRVDLRQQTRLSLTEQVQQTAAAQGLQVTQTGTDAQLDVAVSHENFAVLASWLTRLAENGAEIKQLDIQQQNDGRLQMQAQLRQPAA